MFGLAWLHQSWWDGFNRYNDGGNGQICSCLIATARVGKALGLRGSGLTATERSILVLYKGSKFSR